MTLVMAEDQGNGLGMWSRLKERDDQNRSEEVRTIMGTVAGPHRASAIAGAPAIIDVLEKDIQRYELLSGKEIPEDLKIEAIYQICPVAMKEKMDLQRGLGHGDTYIAAKKVILHMAMTAATRAKTKTTREINAIEESGYEHKERNEELYAFGKAGKGKSGQKGQQRGQQVSSGKGKGQK